MALICKLFPYMVVHVLHFSLSSLIRTAWIRFDYLGLPRSWSLVSISDYNRPLALRGHVTKQWARILLMPKIDRAHKNYLTAEIWEEKLLREIFYGTLIFQQSSMICIGRHVGGHTLALQHGDHRKNVW